MKLSYKILLTWFVLSSSQSMAADVKKGNQLYQAYCTQCHGITGDGWGVNTPSMDVLPKDHTDTKGMVTRTDDDIFKAIKEGGKAVSKSNLMPNWDKNMTDDEIRDLVAYVRTVCCEKDKK